MEKFEDWLNAHIEVLKLFNFTVKQPGNLKVNRDLYVLLMKDFDIEGIGKKQFYGLVRLYLTEGNINKAKCSVCGKLCRCKHDYSFHDTCSIECGHIKRKEAMSRTYNAKTEEEKLAIKQKRAKTNIERYGVSTNLQSQEAIQNRIDKFGSNSPLSNKEIYDKMCTSNAEKHNGLSNPYQWEESKNKAKATRLNRYRDENYRNRNKIEQTCLDRYGHESYMSTTEFKERSKQFFIDKFGVDHPMKVPEIIDKIKENNQAKYGRDGYMGSEKFKEQAKAWCLTNYGVEYNCMRKDVRDKSAAKSKINEQWKEYLDSTLEEEFGLSNYSYDFRKGNILIEINPTITHNSTYCIFSNDKPKDQFYHQNKTKVAKEANYRCIHVWDWDDPEKIKYSLLNREEIYARKCVLKEVSKDECNNFLSKYHFQNTCRGQNVRLGLYIGNELLQVMTFGTPRYNKKYEWELLRLCTRPDKVITGGAERLFKHFIRVYSPKSIISYCDMSKFTGTVYITLEFKLIKEGKPSKHWYNTKTKQHFTDNLLRQQGADRLLGTKYGKGTSNEQIMLENNFLEIWDSGQNTYGLVFD